jgi:glycosyltransferase involved in cell wall biosynthesis
LFPTVRIVGQTGRGKGNALASGFAACRGDIVVMLDADGSADPEEIPRFVEALRGGADFAKGSRFLDGGGSADITAMRRMGNRALGILVNLLYGTRYTDLCYGYNAFWTRCLPYMNVDCDGFEVETLINIRVAKAGLRVAEVPSFEENRLYGESNLNTFRDGFRVLKTILRERVRRSPRAAPDSPAAAPASP